MHLPFFPLDSGFRWNDKEGGKGGRAGQHQVKRRQGSRELERDSVTLRCPRLAGSIRLSPVTEPSFSRLRSILPGRFGEGGAG